MSAQIIYFLRPPYPLNRCTHQYFSNWWFAMKMIKNKWAKMLNVYRINFFSIDPSPKKVCVVHLLYNWQLWMTPNMLLAFRLYHVKADFLQTVLISFPFILILAWCPCLYTKHIKFHFINLQILKCFERKKPSCAL